MSSIAFLNELDLGDIAVAGGKACRLGVAARAGLPVPRGFVVKKGAGEGSRLESDVARALEALDLPPGAAVAVRSSSPGEDGGYRSGAGVYESRLNVRGVAAILEAIQECRASASSERAMAYARESAAGRNGSGRAATAGGWAGAGAAGAQVRSGPTADAEAAGARAAAGEPAMAVLVQELVPCDVAGILFTLNPLTADENEMLVEATWGLAAGLASGEVSPDRFVVGFWDGAARKVEVGAKPQALIAAAEGGLEARALPAEKAARPCLSAAELAELAAAGRRVQEVFGGPQDVEFGFADGKLYILQTRPITSYSFAASTGQWTTANFREVMPGFASILGQSQSFHHDFARSQEELFRRLKLWRREDEGTVWARTFFGHGYWNVGATKRVAARIPGFNERSFDRTVGIEPLYEGDGVVTPWNPKTIIGGIPVILALGRQYRLVPREAAEFIDWFEREEPAWDAIRPSDLGDDELARRVEWGLDLHWRANRWALLTSLLSTQAQEDFHRTLAGLERKVPPRDRPSEARLMTGLTGMATARPLHDLWRLARELAGHPDVVATLASESPQELARRLADGAAGGTGRADAAGGTGPARDGRVWSKVRDWIERYRYMSNIDEDLSVPRWCEDPTIPLTMLRGFVLGGGAAAGAASGAVAGAASGASTGGAVTADTDPDRQVERQRQVREEEERKALALGKRWVRFGLDPFWASRFRNQYGLVKSLCWWREETRVYLSRARYHSRRFLQEQARRWAEAGLLETAGDIYWLTRDEVLGLTAGVGRGAAEPGSAAERFAAAREAARRRRAMASLFRDFAVPPNILPGSFGADGLPKGSRRASSPAGGAGNGAIGGPRGVRVVLGGVGCSAGEVTARCRVARRIEEAAALEPGEILVASYANPAWTPLFHLAAGLVLEEGGLLSHSAVVAREYGVPAVLQVKDATRRLHTGDIVTVDGLGGTVTVG